jgi:hypothetical protein
VGRPTPSPAARSFACSLAQDRSPPACTRWSPETVCPPAPREPASSLCLSRSVSSQLVLIYFSLHRIFQIFV